jgi:hypothetical protein
LRSPVTLTVSIAMGEEGNMKRLLQLCRAKLDRWTQAEPAWDSTRGAGIGWLPPSLGPSEASSTLLAGMVDHSAAWYFDRPECGR